MFNTRSMLALNAMMFDGTMLAIQSQQVIAMRLTKFAFGGPDIQREAELMVSEKLSSLAHTGQMMAMAALGGKPDLGAANVMNHYRRKVSANVKRLAG